MHRIFHFLWMRDCEKSLQFCDVVLLCINSRQRFRKLSRLAELLECPNVFDALLPLFVDLAFVEGKE